MKELLILPNLAQAANKPPSAELSYKADGTGMKNDLFKQMLERNKRAARQRVSHFEVNNVYQYGESRKSLVDTRLDETGPKSNLSIEEKQFAGRNNSISTRRKDGKSPEQKDHDSQGNQSTQPASDKNTGDQTDPQNQDVTQVPIVTNPTVKDSQSNGNKDPEQLVRGNVQILGTQGIQSEGTLGWTEVNQGKVFSDLIKNQQEEGAMSNTVPRKIQIEGQKEAQQQSTTLQLDGQSVEMDQAGDNNLPVSFDSLISKNEKTEKISSLENLHKGEKNDGDGKIPAEEGGNGLKDAGNTLLGNGNTAVNNENLLMTDKKSILINSDGKSVQEGKDLGVDKGIAKEKENPPPESIQTGVTQTVMPQNKINEPARLAEAPRTEMLQQLSKDLESFAKSGQQMLRVQLHPESLGRIELQLTSDWQGVRIVMNADQPSTAFMLEHHLGELKETLQQAGVNLAGLSVNSGNSQSNPNGTSSHHPAYPGNRSLNGQTEIPDLTMENSMMHWTLDSSSQLDYRI